MAAIGLSTQRNSKDGLADWLACCLGRGEYAPLSRADAEERASVLTEEFLPAGAPITSQGDRPETVMIVREGEVALYRRAGGRNLMLSVLRTGEVLADIPLISRMPMLYTPRTMTPARILHLRREDFERLLIVRPRIALKWLLSAAQRMERTQRRLLEVLGEDLQSQLCMLLLDRADKGRVNLSQQTLADLVGAQRSSVNRVLKNLQKLGLISVAYREIGILDPEGLESRTSLRSVVVPGANSSQDGLHPELPIERSPHRNARSRRSDPNGLLTPNTRPPYDRTNPEGGGGIYGEYFIRNSARTGTRKGHYRR